MDSGWELYIGGNGGIKTEAGEFFVKVKSAEEVMEYSLAFLQLYREEAFYLERTVHYLQRVGMDHIKQAVLNDAERRRRCTSGCCSRFLRAGPVAGAASAAAEEGIRPHRRQAAGKRLSTDLEGHRMNWLDICALDEINPLGSRIVAGPKGDIAIFRTADDQVFALDDRCPHKGGPLSQGIVYGKQVACPRTTGRSIWPAARPWPRTSAAPIVTRARRERAYSFR